MRVKYVTVYEWIIYIIIILNLGFFNVFSSYSRLVTFMTAILAVILSIIYYLHPIYRFSDTTAKLLQLYIICLIFIYFWNIIKVFAGVKSSASIGTLFMSESGWFLLLVSFPFAAILKEKNFQFLKNIAYLGLVILIVKFLVWFLYNYFSLLIAPGYFRLGLGWQRSIGGKVFTRMDGTFLDPFTFLYFYIKFRNSEKNSDRIYCAIPILFCLFYEYFVYQSRSNVLYFILTIFITELFLSLKSRNKTLSIGVFLLISSLLFIIFKDYIVSFLNTFNPNDTMNAYSNSSAARIFEINYFGNLWKSSNIFTGFGLINDTNIVGNSHLYISDIGILGYLFEYGYIGFFIFIFPFLLGLVILIKNKISRNNIVESLLVMLNIYLIIGQVNLNPYWYTSAMLMPIFIGLLLYFENEANLKSNYS